MATNKDQSSEKNPLVSIIIPTYNRAHLIGRAIETALGQAYQNIEIIVIDDASSDETSKEMDKLKDERIKYIRHINNKGPAAARTTGIRAARGTYIAFLDSDDEWLPEKLEKQIKIMEGTSPEVGVIYTGCRRIMKGKEYYIPNSKIRKKEGYIFNTVLRFYMIYMSSVVIKSDVFRSVGLFDEGLPAIAEWDLWIRISKQYLFKYINEQLVISYYTSKSMSTDRRNSCRAAEIILRKHFKEFIKNKEALIKILYWIVRSNIGDFLHKIGFIQ